MKHFLDDFRHAPRHLNIFLSCLTHHLCYSKYLIYHFSLQGYQQLQFSLPHLMFSEMDRFRRQRVCVGTVHTGAYALLLLKVICSTLSLGMSLLGHILKILSLHLQQFVAIF